MTEPKGKFVYLLTSTCPVTGEKDEDTMEFDHVLTEDELKETEKLYRKDIRPFFF